MKHVEMHWDDPVKSIEGLAKVVRESLDFDRIGHNCCVLASRVFAEAMNSVAMSSRVVGCQAVGVWHDHKNKATHQRCLVRGDVEGDSKLWEDGHAMVITEWSDGQRFLVDLTISQMHHLGKNKEFPLIDEAVIVPLERLMKPMVVSGTFLLEDEEDTRVELMWKINDVSASEYWFTGSHDMSSDLDIKIEHNFKDSF